MASVGNYIYGAGQQVGDFVTSFTGKVAAFGGKISGVFFQGVQNVDILGQHLKLVDVFSSCREVFFGIAPTTVEQNITASAKHLKGWVSLAGLKGSFDALSSKANACFKKWDRGYFEDGIYDGLDVSQAFCGCLNKIYDSVSFLEKMIKVPALADFSFSKVYEDMNFKAVALGSTIRTGFVAIRFFDQLNKTRLEVLALKVAEGTSTVLFAGAMLNGVAARSPAAVALNSFSAVVKVATYYYERIA